MKVYYHIYISVFTRSDLVKQLSCCFYGDIYRFHRKVAKSAKKRYFSFAAGEDGKRKKSIATRYFLILNARRARFLLFSVLSTENNKTNDLCVLCASNERLVGSKLAERSLKRMGGEFFYSIASWIKETNSLAAQRFKLN